MSQLAGEGGTSQPQEAARPPSFELFMTQLAEIAPHPGTRVMPDSNLIEDLRFDESAFGRLSALLYRHYGVGGLSLSSMRSEEQLTVEAFFRRCVLEVLGFSSSDEDEQSVQ